MTGASFSSRLRELRTERFGTQEAFAHHAGVSRASVQNWERGTQAPGVQVAARLADVLGVSLDYLSGRTGKHERTGASFTVPTSSMAAFDGLSDETLERNKTALRDARNALGLVGGPYAMAVTPVRMTLEHEAEAIAAELNRRRREAAR